MEGFRTAEIVNYDINQQRLNVSALIYVYENKICDGSSTGVLVYFVFPDLTGTMNMRGSRR